MAHSMRGKVVDMTSLAKKYEQNIALGNAHTNGRGDILEGGKVVKTREEVLAEWYATHTHTEEKPNLKESDVEEEVKESTEVSVKTPKRKTPKYEDITEEEKNELKKMHVEKD